MTRPTGRAYGPRAAWAQDQPLAGADHWWLLTSLIRFVAAGVLVPTVFLPHGKIFESSLEDAKQRGEVTPELGRRSAIPRFATRERPNS